MEAAKARVRERLETPVCAEFRSELAGYIAGTLLESRRLLVEDHLGRCAPCRRALAEARGESPAKMIAMPASRWAGRLGQYSRIAAVAAVAAVGLYAGRERIDSALAPSGPRATVESVNGQVIALATGRPLAPGATIHEGDAVRTTTGSRATLRLRDGSALEMNERSELAVRAAWSGQRIHLERGDVIVQAAKQRRGRLQLMTRDTTSSVKGTVFAVSTGVAGSVVSVVEGAVEVAQGGGAEKLVKPGQQVYTSERYTGAGVRDAISWSPNAEKYYALLAEFANLEKEISAVLSPGLRTKSTLLPRLLPDTLVYAAVPNTDGAIDRAVRLLENRARENATLKEWWDANTELKQILERLQTASALLGDEIVFMLARDNAPLIVAEAKPGREAALKDAMDKVVAPTGAAYVVNGSLLMISANQGYLTQLQPQLGKGASSPFAAEIEQRYARGAGWILAADTTQALHGGDEQHRAIANALGVGLIKSVVLEQRGTAGRDDNQVTASFQGARQGITSWLGTPGAFGSPEYISPNAIAAVAATTRNPRQAFDELINSISKVRPDVLTHLREFEQTTGINFSADIAASIGTDFSVSMETVALPMPGWVGALEVYSPAGIDSVLQRAAGAAQPKLTISKETVSGRVWNSITDASKTQTLYWTYDGGYLIFGPDRAIAARAIATRVSGTPLVRSARFREMQPATPTVHNSGFVWLNTRGALESLVAASGTAAPAALKGLLTSRDPVLIVFNGETERIAAFSRTRLTSLLIDVLLTTGADGKSGGPRIEKKLMKRNATGD
jgi:ferric-dicitrate binding protein FerR (iron transport regulator)